MRVKSVSGPPYRPRIKRVNPRERPENRASNDFEWPSLASTNRMLPARPSQVAPEPLPSHSWQPVVPPPQAPPPSDNNDKNQSPFRQTWFWVFAAVFCLILILAVVAIVLGLVLPMTTVAPNQSGKLFHFESVTLPSSLCSDLGLGSIASFKNSIPSGWNLFTYSYTATETFSTLSFAFKTDGVHRFYLDEVSFLDTTNGSSTEILVNPSFENSPSNLTDWIVSCESSCATALSQIVSGPSCYQSMGHCLEIDCSPKSSSIIFIRQSFVTIIGNRYQIRFRLNQVGISNAGAMSFYLDIY